MSGNVLFYCVAYEINIFVIFDFGMYLSDVSVSLKSRCGIIVSKHLIQVENINEF